MLYRKIRHADPRWKTNQQEVIFDQKGLFQADVSVHHALCTAALQNYHASIQSLQRGDPLIPWGESAIPDPQLSSSVLQGNVWGFQHMPERIAAAQEVDTDCMEADAEAPAVRLPQLQVQHFRSPIDCGYTPASQVLNIPVNPYLCNSLFQ